MQLPQRHSEAGFTLLELMVVVAILAIMAGTVVLNLDSFQDDAARAVAEREMQELRQALLHFHNDTGYFPKDPNGPFHYDNIPTANLPDYVQALPDTEQRAWFGSPANFWLLYGRDDVTDNPNTPFRENCPLYAGHSLCTWQSVAGVGDLGWRGPYLSRHGEGLVDIGSNLQIVGSGSPVAGSTLLNVRGVADPFVHPPAMGGGVYGRCADPSESKCLLDWRTLPSGTSHDRWGRPYLLFDLDNGNARIVGMGPDGQYDGVNAADNCVSNDDDLVVCLLR